MVLSRKNMMLYGNLPEMWAHAYTEVKRKGSEHVAR